MNGSSCNHAVPTLDVTLHQHVDDQLQRFSFRFRNKADATVFNFGLLVG